MIHTSATDSILPVLVIAALGACASGGASLTLRVSGAGADGEVAGEVYVDGDHVGRAPLSGVSVSPGEHRVRIDCEFEGKSHRGSERVVDVPAGADAVIEHTCDVRVLLGN